MTFISTRPRIIANSPKVDRGSQQCSTIKVNDPRGRSGTAAMPWKNFYTACVEAKTGFKGVPMGMDMDRAGDFRPPEVLCLFLGE